MTVIVLAAAAGLGLAGLVTWLRRRWVLVTVDGQSMVPALAPGDRVLVRRIPPAAVRIGEVVVVEEPVGGRWGTPPLAGGAAPGAARRWIVKRVVARVPPGQVVLLGDNRLDSCDSRNFGLVPDDRILGSVRRVLRR
jgi:signal peptidase I